MNWNDLKFYLTVARVNNITEASLELGVSASTVARRIAELESDLGTVLFNKRPTGYFLSKAGEEIFELVGHTEASLSYMERRLKNYNDINTHTVKIELPELLGQYIVVPELLALRKIEPGINFEVVNKVENSKLSSRESDIVIRLSMPKNGSYTTRKIGSIYQAPYSSNDYFKSDGHPSSSSEFANHTLIGWNKELRHLPLARWFSDLTNDADLWLETGNYNLQLEAVCSGLGIAVLPKIVAGKFGLKQVQGNYEPLISEMWLMRSVETGSFKHVKKVADFIEKAITSKLR